MSRPKTQESPLKSKVALQAVQSGDLRSRAGSNSVPPKQHDKSVAEISMKEFLDFLKISYQVNEAIDNNSPGFPEKGAVDWKKLTSDVLINRLKEREALINKENVAKLKSEDKTEVPPAVEKTQAEVQSDPENSQPPKIATRQFSEGKLLGEKKPDEAIVDTEVAVDRLVSTLSLDRKVTSEKCKRQSLGRKKSQSFKKEGSVESETSRSDGTDDRTPSKLLKKKLNEVLQEGIFDSVLPYLLPKQQQHQQTPENAVVKKPFEIKKSGAGNLEKNGSTTKEKFESQRKSVSKADSSDKNDKKDIEVVIHVCDEIKNLKRDFRCSQKLLISQMGYFAEVTTGQRLEDMDISVHCDVTIFDWLMRWVQKDSLSEEHWPTLDSSIVIPVLMSSAFLQMTSLQEHCLIYCKSHINDIIRDSPNLSCINDNVLTKLANLFSNTEIECIVDKKDKIQSKLFCKLIAALSEPNPQPHRGHFSSLATLYRCSKCLKLILRNMSSWILCVASNMKMDRNGTMLSTHVYDSSWNLSDYVRDLKADLKTWRRVYWRLWAECHFLFCQACEEHFPVHQMNWCRFHVDSVQYFPIENQRSVYYSIGRYPCCGERSYRFEAVKRNFGCQYRSHAPHPKTRADVEVLRIWNFHKDVIKEEPPPLVPAEKSKGKSADGPHQKNSLREGFWWEGMEIVPSKLSTGLLNKVWETVVKKDDSKTAGNNSGSRTQKSPNSLPVHQTSIQEMSSFSDSSDESSSSSNAGNSEESYHSASKIMQKYKNSNTGNSYSLANRLYHVRKEKKRKKKKKKKAMGVKNEGNRFWLSKLSTRCNQDNQREFEERALRQIESILAKKLSGESFRTAGIRSNYQVAPAGGVYVKLEQEWREAHCFSHGCPGSSIKARGSASYVNVNNSSFSVQRRSKSRGHR